MTELAKGYVQVLLTHRDDSIVTALSIPPFEVLPEVILLGSRAFVRLSKVTGGGPHYREATSYATPVEEDGTE